MALLELVNVSKNFGGLQAVLSLDLAVNPGQVHGLIGPNGSGKTTTLNMISGLYQPSQGTILWRGEKINGLSPAQLVRKGIARTFQNLRLFRHLDVLANVKVARFSRTRAGLLDISFGLPRARAEEKETQERAEEILAFVGLLERARARPGDLPYGQQRLLEIARALASEPSLLLLDEPAAGLIPREKEYLMELIRRLRDQWGLTVLLVEHDMRVVMNVCQRVTVLNFGQKLAEGSPEEIMNHPEVVRAYLGVAKDVWNVKAKGLGRAL